MGAIPISSTMKKLHPEAMDFIKMVLNIIDNDPVLYEQLVNNFMEEANAYFINKPLVRHHAEVRLVKSGYDYGSPRYKPGQSPETDDKEILDEFFDGGIGWPSRRLWNEKQK